MIDGGGFPFLTGGKRHTLVDGDLWVGCGAGAGLDRSVDWPGHVASLEMQHISTVVLKQTQWSLNHGRDGELFDLP